MPIIFHKDALAEQGIEIREFANGFALEATNPVTPEKVKALLEVANEEFGVTDEADKEKLIGFVIDLSMWSAIRRASEEGKHYPRERSTKKAVMSKRLD